jgi:uncharacterized protein YcfJ
MNNRVITSALAIPLMAACAADADYRDYSPAETYGSGGYTDYAEVVDVEPIVRIVQVSSPQRECWQEEVHYRDQPSGGGNTAAGMILGGLAGAVIGHQFGHGDDRNTNSLAGGIIGSGVGYGLSNRAPRAGGYDNISYEERCRTLDNYHSEEHIEGYRVTYLYHGQTFTTQLPYDPGERLRVHVDVDPAQY